MDDAVPEEDHGVRFKLPEAIMKSPNPNPKHFTIVIKLGTSSIVDEHTHQPKLSILSLIVETVTKLRKDGHRVVLVSSGAIGVGLQRMQIDKRPKTLSKKQALAAIGQCRLMSIWDSLFTHVGQPVAQVLLTRNDIADRTQYQNAQNTFKALMKLGVVPIVNENDTLSVSEIKFGDNDTLSAFTAAMVSADYLFLMTDVDCLYTSNPRSDPDAKPIELVSDISSLTADVSSAGSALGTGGMSTKITAARLATSAGVTTVITKSDKPGNVLDIVNHVQALKTLSAKSLLHKPADGESSAPVMVPVAPLHTRFLPSSTREKDRSIWLQYGLPPHGTIYIDEGAHKALSSKAGLFPIGVVDVEGHFNQQEAVRIVVVKRTRPPPRFSRAASPNSSSDSSRSSTPPLILTPETPIRMDRQYSSLSSAEKHIDILADFDQDLFKEESHYEHINDPPQEVGRALVNYSSSEIRRIAGLRSVEISGMLGYADSEYVALRENICLTQKFPGTKTPESKSGTTTPSRMKFNSLNDFA